MTKCTFWNENIYTLIYKCYTVDSGNSLVSLMQELIITFSIVAKTVS